MLIWIKILVAIFIVMLLSFVAERVSPKVAGLLSGYPLGSAIVLFFYGAEISPAFAAKSALYTLVGLVASQVFVYCYYRASITCKRFIIFLSSVAAILGYLLAAWVLHLIPHLIPVTAITAASIPVTAVFLFVFLFRSIKNKKIEKRVSLTHRVLFLRALSAATIIVMITGAAHTVGSAWAGLFSAFPITLFPLMLIVHHTYGAESVHTIIKNFPIGLGALIAYSLSISFAYPTVGLALGTVISFGAATFYLLAYAAITRRVRSSRAGA